MKAAKNILKLLTCVIALFALSPNAFAQGSPPIATDSRIKTFVYSENEVFRVVVHYGYQTSIEFADGEEIQMVSLGNNYAWQLTPSGRRLFIKPLEENIITNMTVLTNMHAYHFEVQSKLITYTIDEEFAYVVRFYYPELDMNKVKRRENMLANEQSSGVTPTMTEDFNFNYEVTGSMEVAPIQVFDNGINTFFRFNLPNNEVPEIRARKVFGYNKAAIRQRGNFVVIDDVVREYQICYRGQEAMVRKMDYNLPAQK